MIEQKNAYEVEAVTLRYYTTELPATPLSPRIKDRISNLMFMIKNQPNLILIALFWLVKSAIVAFLSLIKFLLAFLTYWIKCTMYIFMPTVIIATYFNRDIQNLQNTFSNIVSCTLLLGFAATIFITLSLERVGYMTLFEEYSFSKFPIMTFWELKDNQFKAHNIYANPMGSGKPGYTSKTEFVLNSDHDLLVGDDKRLIDAWRNKLLKLNRDANSTPWKDWENEHAVAIPRQAKTIY
ncbi:hypothetical protein HAU32_07980 [Weissella confusa]|uniref:Uncharacterized protein n=1 Tax=Weissella fermenti TaxID=2987699 RepID=A0ABT6D250_9LACO|nr:MULTISPECIES: hypothetical protein [Weissella]MBJ7688910.1 hypothetical protein [Weissella confusa]MCW0926305.1 hypothetical protein [Weissella sp. LMG 11983]MDF9298728.1 hypothetical protein [Weissella sp. BK2]